MARENKTKYAILGVLSIMPASGYDIKKYCDQSINHFWSENYGHIYPVLRQLEEAGWASKTVQKDAGKPERNVYTITEAGREALAEWLMIPPEAPQARYEFLLKLFFSGAIPHEVTQQRMEQSRAFCEGLLVQYGQIEAHIRECMVRKPSEANRLYFQLTTVRYGIHSMQGTIAWCTEVIDHLETMKGV